jgi:hypothetical protein
MKRRLWKREGRVETEGSLWKGGGGVGITERGGGRDLG